MRYIPKLQFGDQLNLLRKVSKSNVDFINRLRQSNRDVIKDWASPNIATHKMSWATDDQGAIIYPQVQNINGKLTDFSRPPYNKWAGLDSAIEKGDTLKTTPELAQWFTTNYKKFFPKFSKGGTLIPKAQIGRTLTYNWASPTDRTVNWLNQRIYNAVDPTMASIGTKEVIGAGLATTLGLNLRDKTKYPVEEAAWKKRLNLSYDKKYLLDNADGSVRLPDSLGNQIVTDTNFVKNRIVEQKDLQKHYLRNGRSRSAALDMFIKLDEQHLDSLRKFYSTGKPVVINEFGAWKDRKVINPDTGKLLPNVISPYNALGNFTLYKDPELGKAYKDVYDFNEIEKLVPGEAFVIKGAIK